MINTDKLTITQIDQMTAFNNLNELEFIMDEMTDATISNSEEKSDIVGRGGRKISSLKKNKAVTVKGTSGLIVGGAIAAMTGSSIESGSHTIRYTDVLTVHENKATVARTPSGVSGSEIGAVYIKNSDGTLGKKLTQAASADTTGHFTVADKQITLFAGDVKDGEEIVAFYDVNVDSAKISNDSETYGKTLKVYLDCRVQDTCDNIYHAQFIVPRCDFSGTFDLTFGNEPSTLAWEGQSLAGGYTGSTKLWDLIIFGDETNE